MVFRVFVSLGLLALGYYVGREIGRGEPIRREMENLRDDERRKVEDASTQPPQPPPDESNS